MRRSPRTLPDHFEEAAVSRECRLGGRPVERQSVGRSRLLRGGLLLQDRKRAYDLLVINNLRPHPSAIGQAGKKEHHQRISLQLEPSILKSSAHQHQSENGYHYQQTFQNREVKDIRVFEVAISIDQGE